MQRLRRGEACNVEDSATFIDRASVNRTFWEGMWPALPGLELDYASAMGRPNRPNIPGAIYHVMNRGNRKCTIFEDDRDRRRFVRILIEEQATYCVRTL